jgi:hypothetical protein
MHNVFRRQVRQAVLPAATVLLLLLILWCWGRWGYAAKSWEALRVSVFAGWLAAMFLATTVAAIVWTAGAPDSRHDSSEVFLGFALLLDACGLLLLCVGLGTGMVGLWDILRVYLLLAAWAGMWATITWTIRQSGHSALAAVVALAGAMLCFAAPVTFVPLARAFAGPAQEIIVNTVRFSAPMLGVFDAMKASLPLPWAQLPEMYRLTSFGQNIPMDNPHWWSNLLGYAAITLAAWAIARLTAAWASRE